MLKPYTVIEETDHSVTYRYNSFYSWYVLLLISLMILSVAYDYAWFQLMVAGLIGLYFLLKILLGKDISRTIKTAVNVGSVEVSGSKYSFSKPLTIKVPKNTYQA